MPESEFQDDTMARVARFRAACEAQELPANIPALIDRAAAAHGDKRLWHFIEGGAEITYRCLAEATQRLAASLARIGVGPGSHVGVMLPNIAEFPITWIALARLGAVMVPINIRYTPREIAYVLTDSGATHLVLHADQLPGFRAGAETRMLIGDAHLVVAGAAPAGLLGWDDAVSAPGAPPVHAPALDDLMNIQYTSGTTGFPKGCMLSHRYWLVMSQVAAFRIGSDIRNVLAAQPFYYMDPQWLLLMTIRLGGTLFVAPGPSTSRFMEWIHRYSIEYCIFPGVMMKQPPAPDDATSLLRKVSFYGLARGLQSQLERRFGVTAREGFGMTEIGSGITTPFDVDDMVDSGSCGAASPFRETTIRDENGDELPDGEVGELWVRGPGILQGYWNKPEANTDSFRPGGWFRTGDLFRRDARGFHTIVGRLKDMIRRSGENIAAREVEAVVQALPAVQEAAAIGVPDAVRGQEVLICIVLKSGMVLEPDALFAHCAAQLARFKVPRYAAFRDALPKTPSEKVAKHVLVAEKPDLRVGAYDRVDAIWR